MADVIDDANERADVFLRESLAWRRQEATAEPTGACLNCEAPVTLPLRWCDGDCRDDWAARNRTRDIPPEQQRKSILPAGASMAADHDILEG
jgi:hypothetical protein